MSRRKLSDLGVANLKPRASRYSLPDPELSGHYVRVTPTGSKTFACVARDPVSRKQIWHTVGPCDAMAIAEARRQAASALQRIRAGQQAFEPAPPKPDTLRAVSELYLRRHVVGRGLRTGREIVRILQVCVLPVLGDREFTSIRRTDIAKLLDTVEDERGKAMADKVLAVFGMLANWFASRNDDYVAPISKGMRRSDPASRTRSRILDDDELRLVCQRAGEQGSFGAFVKLLLLTCQRRSALAAMRWDDIVDGEWNMPVEQRAKGVGGDLILPRIALAILSDIPRMGGNPYVFPDRQSYFRDFSTGKTKFDAGLPHMPRWTLHDLRRTSRSLMSRAGVRPDIAERVLGHVISGVEGIYDRHDYKAEKGRALEALAALIETIINPPAGNVVPIRGAAQ